MSKLERPRCDQCRFWEPLENRTKAGELDDLETPIGQCRRNAPTADGGVNKRLSYLCVMLARRIDHLDIENQKPSDAEEDWDEEADTVKDATWWVFRDFAETFCNDWCGQFELIPT